MKLTHLLLISSLLIPCHSYGMEKEAQSKTSLQKHKKSSEKGASDDGAYEILQQSSALFLNPKKLENHKGINELFNEFKKLYKKRKEQHLDITDCSSRARIELLRRIIEAKVETMPLLILQHYTEEKNFHQFNKAWETMSEDEVVCWKATHKGESYEVIDRIPTHFKIGGCSYKFELWPTYGQPGNGKLYGIIEDNRPETHFFIGQAIKKTKSEHRRGISQKLQEQKKHGKPINKNLNGVNLLFDYEVARRTINGDEYSDLPIIYIMPSLINNLFENDVIDNFLVGKSTGQSKEKVSLFAGKGREEIVKKFINSQENLKSISTLEEARQFLIYSHKSDEDSREDAESMEKTPLTSQPIKSNRNKQSDKTTSEKKQPINNNSKTSQDVSSSVKTNTGKKSKNLSEEEEKDTKSSKHKGESLKGKADKKEEKKGQLRQDK